MRYWFTLRYNGGECMELSETAAEAVRKCEDERRLPPEVAQTVVVVSKTPYYTSTFSTGTVWDGYKKKKNGRRAG